MKNLRKILYNIFLLIGCIILICSIELPIVTVFDVDPRMDRVAIYPMAIFSIPFFIMGLTIYLLNKKKERDVEK